MFPLLAEIALFPGAIIAWVLVGLGTGFVAGELMRGSRHNYKGDLLVGLAGSLLAGFLVWLLATSGWRRKPGSCSS